MIKEDYKNIGKSEADFGKTIITFGEQHDAVYFGTGSDGEVYVFTKNGWSVEPQIMKLSDLVTKWNYGKVRNPENHLYPNGKTGTGYYNLKTGSSSSTGSSCSSSNSGSTGSSSSTGSTGSSLNSGSTGSSSSTGSSGSSSGSGATGNGSSTGSSGSSSASVAKFQKT